MLNSDFAVLKIEQSRSSRDILVCYGGYVISDTLQHEVRAAHIKPALNVIVQEPPDYLPGANVSWDISLRHDVRREFAKGALFEADLTVSQFKSLKYAEVKTYNTQINAGHLHLLQTQHTITSAAWSILAIDIEASVSKGSERTFPESAHDPILQISFVIQHRGLPLSTQAWVCSVADATDASPSPSELPYKYEEYSTEREILQRFAQIVRESNPDFITGWNVLNFDLAYILDRAIHTGVSLRIGRDGSLARSWEKESHTRAHGTRITQMCEVYGRVVFDSMSAFQRILNEPSYTLQNVAMKYLGTGKDDMPYDQILGHMQTPKGRRRVADYCYKDSLLVIKLLEHFKLMHRFNGIVSVTGAPLMKVIHGGQQIRCFSALLKEVYASNLPFAFPNVETTPNDGYKGATVITPRVGATGDIIATLDFAALYPNIMRAYNMCWSTLLPALKPFPPRMLKECPYHITELCRGKPIRRALSIESGTVVNGACGKTAFAQDTEGLIPRVQGLLYTRRTDVKKKMKEVVEGSNEYEILNAYQLALKLVMNSMYGLLGAKEGYLPEVRIAEAITCCGRMLIEWSRTLAEKHPAGLSVWGGDTDSIFIHAPPDTCANVKEYHAFWFTLAREMTLTYGHPALILEFEMLYMGKPGCLSWVLVAKKRYAGYKWDAFAEKGKLVYTGLECKRRDFCRHLTDTMKELLLNIFTMPIDSAFDVLQRQVIRVFDTMPSDISGFVLSKQYFKKAADYARPRTMPHVQVALRTQANVGDRIEFIITAGLESLAHRALSLSEFSARGNIDTQYYFEKQFLLPLQRITDAIDLQKSSAIWKTIKQGISTVRRTQKRKRDSSGFTRLFKLSAPPACEDDSNTHELVPAS